MKTISKCLIVAAILGSASVAMAADEAMMKKNCDEMMRMHDTNKDGKLSKDEYSKAKMEMFTKYDKNSDGMLSKEEHEMMGMDMHKMMMGDKNM
ncbi:MAG: EF-hand domain-containing protein [Chloroflexota bacterium]|nr:EF-hand domain-containing protein [Chloroflexota bacterium]